MNHSATQSKFLTQAQQIVQLQRQLQVANNTQIQRIRIQANLSNSREREIQKQQKNNRKQQNLGKSTSQVTIQKKVATIPSWRKEHPSPPKIQPLQVLLKLQNNDQLQQQKRNQLPQQFQSAGNVQSSQFNLQASDKSQSTSQTTTNHASFRHISIKESPKKLMHEPQQSYSNKLTSKMCLKQGSRSSQNFMLLSNTNQNARQQSITQQEITHKANSHSQEQVLNIRTAKDINIYNNSFLICNEEVPQNLTSKQISIAKSSRKAQSQIKSDHASLSRTNIQAQVSSNRLFTRKLSQLEIQQDRSRLALQQLSKLQVDQKSNSHYKTQLQKQGGFKTSESVQTVTDQELIEKARKLMQKRKFSEAQEMVKDVKTDDGYFLRGICYLDNNESIQSAKSQFQQCLCKPEAFLMLAICEKRTGNQSTALQLINTCVDRFPDFKEAYIFKAFHLQQMSMFKAALNLYQTCPVSTFVYAGMGQCYRRLKKYDEAVEAYSKAIHIETNPTSIQELRLLKGTTLFESGRFKNALIDFQSVLKQDGDCIQAHFYIGRILMKGVQNEQSQSKDLMLHLEKTATSSDEFVVGNALYLMARICIADKRFHEAHEYLNEAIEAQFKSKRLQLLHDFTEGVLYLIKQKIKKGIQKLSDLIEILKEDDLLYAQALNYRSYGYIAIEKYELALADIKKIKKPLLVLETIYNKFLSKGILLMDHEDYLMASKNFTKAWKLFPSNKDAYCLQTISIVRSFTYSLQGYNIDQQIKYDKVLETKQFIDKAIANCIAHKVPSLHFFRGLLNFQLHRFYESVQDFNEAINQEEDTTPIFYLARGRSFACLNVLTEAMKDISISLNLDETLVQGYYFRGCCAYLLGDSNLALLDFQRLIQCDAKNPMVNIQAGKLLMASGAYQDAIKAFQSADKIEVMGESHYQKARCFIALNKLEEALDMLDQTIQIQQKDMLLNVDYQILQLLDLVRKCLSTEEDSQVKISLQDICRSFTDFIQLYECGKLDCIKKQDAPLSIKLIPNLERIQIEKAQLAKDIKMQKSKVNPDSKPTYDDADFSFSVLSHVGELDDLEQFPTVINYSESIFGHHEILLYRAVIFVYLGQYSEAIRDFQKLQEERIEANQSMSKSYSSQKSYCEIVSIFETECIYNQLVCHLLMNDITNSKQALEQLGKSVQTKQFVDFQEQINQLITKGFCEKIPNLFEKNQRLSSFFKPLKVKGHEISLSFGLPDLRPPNMIPCVDEDAVQSEFNLKQIDAPLPEAPWTTRCSHQTTPFVESVSQSTTPDFFKIQPDQKLQKIEDEKELSMRDRLVKEGILYKRDLSLVSDCDSKILVEQKCAQKSCQSQIIQSSQSVQQISEKTENFDEESEGSQNNLTDSYVKIRNQKLQKSATKFLLSKEQQIKLDQKVQNRYNLSERESEAVMSAIGQRKEPHGLDQEMLAGQGVNRKKRERKVSNLSFSVEDEKQQTNDLFKSKI